MARIDLKSAGVTLSYLASNATAAPTTGYTQLKGLKEVPEMNPSPDTIETTTLDDSSYKTYISGLKDLGGALGFVFNLTQEFVTAWKALITASGTSGIWFEINIPGIKGAGNKDKRLYFQGEPIPLGLPSISVNSVIEVTAYITPLNEPKWVTLP